MTLSGLSNLAVGTYELQVIGDNGTETETKNLSIEVFHPDFDAYPIALTAPSNENAAIPPSQVSLEWAENENAENYEVQVSDNPSFTNIIASSTQTGLNYVMGGLSSNTIYYWRVKASNICGDGSFSETFSFQTGTEDCTNTYTGTDFTSASISTAANVTAFVPVEINDDMTINRLIVDMDVTHSYVADLTVYVQEPSALGSNNIILLERQCGGSDNIFDTTFNDTGSDLSCSADSPAVTGIIKPEQSLASSAGKSSLGTWFVAVFDGFGQDGGQIDSASITVCSSSANTNVPSFTNNLVDIAANGTDVIQTSDIEASTASETAAQQTYTVVTLPTSGTIRNNGVILLVGDTFTQEDVDLGNIAYVNTQPALFTDSFKVDITNGVNGWLPNQVINLSASVVSAPSFELSNLSVYPNPTGGTISIRFEAQTDSDVRVEIYDLQGRSIYKRSFNGNSSRIDESMNIGRIANGVYLIKINQGNRSTTKRIIISK